MKHLLKIALFVLGFFAVARFCKIQTDSFTIARISSSLTYNPTWDVPPLSPEETADLKKTLDQPYFYLSKGAQAFVFASQDGQYVIKFFRHHHMSAPFWLKHLPFKWARQSALKKKSKLAKDFSSYKIAYDRFKNQTGLLFLHLNKTSDHYPTLDLVDKLGIHHPIPLDQYEFLIQKRASLVYPALETMIQNKDIAQAKEALSGLVHLLADRMHQGIFDKDPDLNTNFGLIGTQPIQIDFGRYKTRAPGFDRQEIIRITDHLHQWLMVRSPELDEHLRHTINSL